MRNIKFRGKSKFGIHEWLYGSLLMLNGKTYICPDKATVWNMTKYEVVPETVGQFSGILDKNDIEIYEGDIVECIVKNGYDFGFIGIVDFENGIFGIRHTTYKGYVVSCFSYSSEWNDGHTHGTVLYEYKLKGNICDNPNLIKS